MERAPPGSRPWGKGRSLEGLESAKFLNVNELGALEHELARSDVGLEGGDDDAASGRRRGDDAGEAQEVSSGANRLAAVPEPGEVVAPAPASAFRRGLVCR